MTLYQQILWNACSETEDYFSRLGGSGRYPGFNEYHIPALVLILALEKIEPNGSPNDALRRLLPERMWNETDGLPCRVSKTLNKLVSAELGSLREFVEYVNNSYQETAPNELVFWRDFLEKVEGLGWHI